MAQKGKKIRKGLLSKGSSDFILVIVTLFLVALGLIMVLSASSPSSLSEFGNSYRYLRTQAFATGIGFVLMLVLSRINYQIYKKFKWILYGVTLALLIAVSFIGIEANGARRWIKILGINFQPSEVSKLTFILFFAALLTDLKESGKIKILGVGCWWPIVLLGPVVISIFILQNHFSATLIICTITIIQMFVAGTPIKNFLITGGIAAPVICGYIISKMGGNTGEGSFRSTRIKTWLDPFKYPTDEGYQIIQSLYAIGSGGLFGVGLGESKQKYLYLPEPQNDFIFAVLAEELGFFGCMIVIILFAIFIWRGIVIAMNAKDSFGTLIAIGIVSLIGLQAIINIAVVTGTIPVTGMPLPFFSYGGTAIMVNLASVGVLLNISRKENSVK